MWSKGYATPLRLDLRPARSLRLAVTAMHCLAFGIVLTVPATGWQRFLLALLVVASGYRLRTRHPLWTNERRITALVWGRDNDWEIERAGGVEPARLGKEAVVTPWLVIVHLERLNGDRISVPILRDMLDKDTFRRLCVRLRLTGPAL